MTAGVEAGTRQYGSFLTLPDVKEWLRMPQPLEESPEDNRLRRLVGFACTSVQQHINRPVGAQEFWERHDGWSGEYIMLKESPLVQLVACTEWQSSYGSQTLLESTPSNPIDGIQVDYSTGRIMRTFAGYSWPRPFFPGSRNIEVTYLAGFNPVPDDIWLATAQWIKDMWANLQAVSASPTPGLAASEEYDSGDENQQSTLRGVPHWVESILEPYRLPSIA